MKLFLAFGLAFAGALGVMTAAPPHGGSGGSGAITRTGALGGPVAANGAMSHPLGGFPSTGSRNFRGVAKPSVPRVYPYGYAWYLPSYSPSYFSGGDDSYYGAAASAPAPDATSAPQQPVIINQYFGAEHFGAEPAPQAVASDPPQTAGDPIGTPQNYYLIAY